MTDDKQFTILLVDDIPANTRTAARVLEHAGYRTLAVHRGHDALVLVREENVDLILLDIMMPEMNGFETCAQLKRNSRSAAIPIIFVTALGDTDSITRGFEAGGVDYVVKPFRRAELLMRVKTHLDLKKLQDFFADSNARLHQEQFMLERHNQALSAVATRMETYLRPPLTAMNSCLDRLQARLQDDHDSFAEIQQLRDLQARIMTDMEALQIMAAVNPSTRNT
jgi:two-component system, sensor histidine kinase and response regulator